MTQRGNIPQFMTKNNRIFKLHGIYHKEEDMRTEKAAQKKLFHTTHFQQASSGRFALYTSPKA